MKKLFVDFDRWLILQEVYSVPITTKLIKQKLNVLKRTYKNYYKFTELKKGNYPKMNTFVILYDKMFDDYTVWYVDTDPSKLDLDYTHWMYRPEKPVFKEEE